MSEIPKQAAATVMANATDMLVSPPGRAALVSPTSVVKAMDYLYWFGYLTSDVGLPAITGALRQFQSWFGVTDSEEDGKLGLKTFKAMTYPRCGCPDKVDRENGRHVSYMRLQEFREQSQKRWQKSGLKYYIRHLLDDTVLAHDVQQALINQAWKQWTNVADLQIEQIDNELHADLVIDTGRGPKDDFDGPAGTLAWAYMPDGSDKQLLMRFDLDEVWTSNTKDNGVCMLNVACHEFGHMLGLNHSRAARALMAPFYNESIFAPQADDDIQLVQAIYGAPKQAVQAASLPSFTLKITGNVEIEGYNLVPNSALSGTP